jgi:hypothetical protein
MRIEDEEKVKKARDEEKRVQVGPISFIFTRPSSKRESSTLTRKRPQTYYISHFNITTAFCVYQCVSSDFLKATSIYL